MENGKSINWNKITVREIKPPFAHIVQDVKSVIFFLEIAHILPEIDIKDMIWFFDDIPVNYPLVGQ